MIKHIVKVLCFFGIHLSGRSGQSCMHNITMCSHCNRDVLFVLHDELKPACSGNCTQGRCPCDCRKP